MTPSTCQITTRCTRCGCQIFIGEPILFIPRGAAVDKICEECMPERGTCYE